MRGDSDPRGALAGVAYACLFAMVFIACWTTTPWLLVAAFLFAMIFAALAVPPE